MAKTKSKRTVREMSSSISLQASPSKKHKQDTAVVLYEGNLDDSTIALEDGEHREGTSEVSPSIEVVSGEIATRENKMPNRSEPPSLCPRCKQNHWLKDCPQPKKPKKNRKTKAKEKETQTAFCRKNLPQSGRWSLSSI